MDDEKSGRVGESIAYNFKLRMTEKSSQMDGWRAIGLACECLCVSV